MEVAKFQREVEFNGEMFRLGREFRGLTQRELAKALDVEPSTLSRIENGLTQAAPDIAERVAKKLHVPIDFLRQQERPYGLPVSVHPMWRSKSAVAQHSVDRALAEMNLRIMHIRRLIRSVEYEPVLPLPEIDPAIHPNGAEDVAALVRRTWMMPAGPVRNLVDWIERAGCFVMYVELPDAAMSGVTLRVPDMRPCIFVNRSMPADRIRFTLAHELGHLVMHRYPAERMEHEANEFASAFLMPANDIRAHFSGKKIDLRLLATLKPEWRVAMQSLLNRAKTLGYVHENQARYLWQQFSMKKLRTREPPELDFPVEQPSLVPKLLSLHLQELNYTTGNLATVATLHESEFTQMYGLNVQNSNRPRLRLVTRP